MNRNKIASMNDLNPNGKSDLLNLQYNLKKNKLSKRNLSRLGIGIFISVLCVYLAFRKVDFEQMWKAFCTVNYWLLLPAVASVFFGVFLRSYRWRFFLDPIKRLDIGSLFSSLMIGYSANMIIPAHLGEVLRAYILSKKRRISMSTTFATIVIERIIDVFSLLALVLLAVHIYPFPSWVTRSSYIIFFGALGLFMFLILMKKVPSYVMRMVGFALKPLPKMFEHKIQTNIEKFLSGILPLKRWQDYITVSILSLMIWTCYGLVFYFTLQAFNFVETYDLRWSTSLILLVITSIALVVPSSPGYIGTYHYFCQISLAMLGVSSSPALSFAAVVHAIDFFPVFILGLFFANYENISIFNISGKYT